MSKKFERVLDFADKAKKGALRHLPAFRDILQEELEGEEFDFVLQITVTTIDIDGRRWDRFVLQDYKEVSNPGSKIFRKEGEFE